VTQKPEIVLRPFPPFGSSPGAGQPVFAAVPDTVGPDPIAAELGGIAPTSTAPLAEPTYGRAESGQQKKMWELVYELFAEAEPGMLLHWEILGEAVGKDATLPSERNLVNVAVRRAIKELEKRDRRTARNVRGYGFKVVSNEERLEIARTHQDKAVKEVALARRQVTNVDLAAMDPNTRRAFELTAMALGRQAQVMDQVNIRQERLETVMDDVLAEQRVNARQREDIQSRLAALEARLGGSAPITQVSPPHHLGAPYALTGGASQQPATWPQAVPQYAGMPSGHFPSG